MLVFLFFSGGDLPPCFISLVFLFYLRWRTCHPVAFFNIQKSNAKVNRGGQNPLAFGHSQLHKCIGYGAHFWGF